MNADRDGLARSIPVRLARHALAATFERRKTALPANVPTGLSESFAQDPTKRAQWGAFLGKNRLVAPPLEVVIAEVRKFIEEPLALARKRSDTR